MTAEVGRLPEPLASRVASWLAADPDPGDRAELAGLVAAGDVRALTERFVGPLAFGTAGLRGPLRAGPAGMNTAVVRRTTAGLGSWLQRRVTGPPVVVIGYDARRRSDHFALDAARVLAGQGARALLLPGPTPTPVLAFAVRHLSAVAGIMITASHNPASDNGYKVYLGGPVGEAGRGAQLVAPADTEIEDEIAAVGPAAAIPLADGWTRLDASIVTAYVEGAVRAVDTAPPVDGPPLRIAYTPLHGVGADVLEAVFTRAGLPVPVTVVDQREPDPDFPTAPFPNPEEPGVLDAVLALGERVGADLVLANDPDADRCAAAVGGRVLTGDEIGLLLADHVLRARPGPVATTVVSSSALVELARDHGVPCTRTLTGFKWIMRADPGLVFGYEEALGYAVAPDLVRDKDGITAALALARAAQREKRAGRTLLDVLDDLHRRIGVFATGQVSVRLDDLAAVAAAMRRLRTSPPDRVAGRPVTAVRDLLTGAVDGPDGLAGLPPADVLLLELDGGARVVARPSGTEPKLKIYLQAVTDRETVAAIGPAAARRHARTELDALRDGAAALMGVPGPAGCP
ncbi:phospho-sugar mutase [Parafrankia sp. BMG5.11]|uniref:phospho-sugar mutase n=1 Tax=Parafrankia sp. BMG5.11 TaxID=222540 RepID=UPI000DA53913|nr:phospho-sugar mutase [Parafrankia sp. BMG5.11]SQD95151.1 putative phosphomannomutase [Parafrankia sp. Ea1.12]